MAAHLPNAALCPPFHRVKLANEALEKPWRDEAGELPVLKRTRFHWLKDAADWPLAEVDLYGLRTTRCRTALAWQMKEALRDIPDWRHVPLVPVVLPMDRWLGRCRRVRLAPCWRIAKTFQAHIDGIRTMLAARNSNARAHSINAAIQAAILRREAAAPSRTFAPSSTSPAAAFSCRHRPLPGKQDRSPDCVIHTEHHGPVFSFQNTL